MLDTQLEVAFSFLASGPTYALPIPAEFDPLPNISTPLANGVGGRSFDFVPSYRDSGMDGSENTLVRLIQRPDGGSAELWQRAEAPPLWWLRWPVGTGVIQSHLRIADADLAEVTVEAIRIVEGDERTPPLMLIDPPMKYIASTYPGYSETAIYLSRQLGRGWSIALQRPGFVAQGTVVESPSEMAAGVTILRAGAEEGLEVKATAPADRDTVERLLSPVLEALGRQT